ncbi:hypothetical protein [Nocardia sp. AG03]|uniref:hypothetical protein n=1 Tax=Nocardia sp. AG03 TaxID=3025312 RepID=UPI00241839ED|nr:hypothetical protein [Nocardia sp. AG03]
MRKLAVGVAFAAVLGVAGCSGEEAAPAQATAPEQSAAPGAPVSQEKQQDMRITASAAAFVPGVFDKGVPATAVLVLVENTSADKVVKVNPLYFSITDSEGGKHSVELGLADDQIGAEDLQPGEKIEGTIAAEGSFTAAKVTFKPLIGANVTVNVTPAQ